MLFVALLVMLMSSEFSAETIDDEKGASGNAPVLFVDWHHVETGRVKPTYDPARLSEKGKAELKKTEEDWNIIADLSGHGMKRIKMAFGVRVAMEKARKSEPWLKPDLPWERRLGGYQTVIHVDGKCRCWYFAG